MAHVGPLSIPCYLSTTGFGISQDSRLSEHGTSASLRRIALQLEIGTSRGRGHLARPAFASWGEERCETVVAGQLAPLPTLHRPVVILPGLGNNSGDYESLVKSLEAKRVAATVMDVSRLDWLRNAAGLLDVAYWKGKLRPRPVLDWYLARIKDAIEIAKAEAGASEDGKVSLIGHSAGGWLARVYMAEFGTEDVSLLLTLGTPHLPPPKGIPGVFDQTRGLLYHVEENCPGAYHAPEVKYVCVAGRYVKGSGKPVESQTTTILTTGAGTLDLKTFASNNEALKEELVAANDESRVEDLANGVILTSAQPEVVKHAQPTFRDRLIGAGYKQVCGKADVWGDGVVPEESAYLEGAINILLDGAYHSPVGANRFERPWYGSAENLEQWVHHLLE